MGQMVMRIRQSPQDESTLEVLQKTVLGTGVRQVLVCINFKEGWESGWTAKTKLAESS
jgi:hypothetical protein